MNSNQRTAALLVSLMISLVMSACGQGQILGPMDTPLPFITSQPSLTPTPTLTVIPSLTPSPTITPTATIPAPTQLSKFFDGVQLTYYESFDKPPVDQWNTQVCQTVNNGELVYTCINGYFGRKNTAALHAGQGILIDFKHPDQTVSYFWSIDLTAGAAGGPDWKIFGISEDGTNKQAITLYNGRTNLGLIESWVKPDVWYRLALALDPDGKIAILVWERDNPDAVVSNFFNAMGPTWSAQQWLFMVNNMQTVTLDLDNYYEFSFDKMK